MASRLARIKAAIHPWLDPLLSVPARCRARLALDGLADGVYRVPFEVPYYAQFASPERIFDYIHHGYDGTQDSSWRAFGADDPADYAFWGPRVCALACLKMAVEAFNSAAQPSLWTLVQEGLALNGYMIRDKNGRWVDEGWYFHALSHLAARYGLDAAGRSYVSPWDICHSIRAGWLVAATVSPQLGERTPQKGAYGGHMVLVYGFEWAAGQVTCFTLHNPSGRFPELQAAARIPAARFQAAFAHRFIALRARVP